MQLTVNVSQATAATENPKSPSSARHDRSKNATVSAVQLVIGILDGVKGMTKTAMTDNIECGSTSPIVDLNNIGCIRDVQFTGSYVDRLAGLKLAGSTSSRTLDISS
jgi:hypothetical protein